MLIYDVYYIFRLAHPNELHHRMILNKIFNESFNFIGIAKEFGYLFLKFIIIIFSIIKFVLKDKKPMHTVLIY